MGEASSCASIYVHHDCNCGAIVEGDLEKLDALNDSIDIRHFDITNELALRFLKYLLTAYFVYGSRYIYVRIPVLQALEERLTGLRPYSRRSADSALAILRKACLFRNNRKPLPGNLGVLIELLPAATAAVRSIEGPPPYLHLVPDEGSQVPRSTPASTPASTLAPVHTCNTSAHLSTDMQKDRTSQGIGKREKREEKNARRSDVRTEPAKSSKKENSKIRFGQILTNQVLSKRAKKRAVNGLIAAVYCEALKTQNRSTAFWALIRSLYEREWPTCPGHSGVDWEQLSLSFPAMTDTERQSSIQQMVLPLLEQQEFADQVDQVDAEISTDQVDGNKAAIDHLKGLVDSGELSQDEGLVMLRAQQNLMSRRPDFTD